MNSNQISFNKIVLHTNGTPENLVWEPAKINVHDGHVIVEVWYAGVGFADIMAQRGGYNLAPKLPFTPGYDFVGRVINPLDSQLFNEGDLVGALMPTMCTYTEILEVPENRLVKLPHNADPILCSAAILNYLTAACLLLRKAEVVAGDVVFIQGASGGVGTALAEMGRKLGLKMYGTASAAKHDLLKSRGVVPIDYKNKDFVREIKSLEPNGIDAVFDAIGGQNLSRSSKILKRGGRLVSYGFSGSNYGGNKALFKGIIRLLFELVKPNGVSVRICPTPKETEKHPEWYRSALQSIFQDIADGHLHPLVDSVQPMMEAPSAHRKLENGNARGKLILATKYAQK